MNKAKEIKNLINDEKHSSNRPLGITIISIIGLIASIVTLLSVASILLIGDTSYVITYSDSGQQVQGTTPIEQNILLCILGVAGLVGNWLLLKMRRNGFYIVIATIFIVLIQSILDFNLINTEQIIIGYTLQAGYYIPVTIYLLKKRNLFVQ